MRAMQTIAVLAFIGLTAGCFGKVGEPCTDDLECGEGKHCDLDTAWCVDGPRTCTADPFELDETICDGVDNDCDGFDNDCDGSVDISLVPDDCGEPDQGVCAGATAARTCLGEPGWSTCGYGDLDHPYEANNETLCDDADNNCDGYVDELEHLVPPGASVLTCAAIGVCISGSE